MNKKKNKLSESRGNKPFEVKLKSDVFQNFYFYHGYNIYPQEREGNSFYVNYYHVWERRATTD